MPAKANTERADLEKLLVQVAEHQVRMLSHELYQARRKLRLQDWLEAASARQELIQQRKD
jgi:hypothetical protein